MYSSVQNLTGTKQYEFEVRVNGEAGSSNPEILSHECSNYVSEIRENRESWVDNPEKDKNKERGYGVAVET